MGQWIRSAVWAVIVGLGAVLVVLPHQGSIAATGTTSSDRLVAHLLGALTPPDHSALPPYLRPFRPGGIQVINGLGRLIGGERLVSLTPAALVEAACAAARDAGLLNTGSDCPLQRPNQCADDGMTDADGPCWVDGLRVLVDSLEGDADLTLLGRVVVKGAITETLKSRAALESAWESAPPTAVSQEIIKPILIVGMPRTGTTLLHNLLNQDPALRAPQTWELTNPVPRPPHDPTPDFDPAVAARISLVDHNIDQYKQLIPGMDAMHPIAATQAEECTVLLSHSMDSVQFEAMFPVSGYARWLYTLPRHRRAMQWHKRVLQWLQGPDTRQWLLKSPYFFPLLEDVRETYPDARIIHTHREPTEVFASTSSLMAKLYGAVSDSIDLHAIGREQVATYATVLTKATALRSRWDAEKAPAKDAADFRVFDVHLWDLQQNPIGVVRRLYTDLLGRELSDDVETRMKTWLAMNKRDKHGHHRHSPVDFGINTTNDPRFEPYRHYFDVKPAMSHG